MKTSKIKLSDERLVKITLVMRSAANFKSSCIKDFGISPKGWKSKLIKKNENEYLILLKTTTESGGALVNVSRLGSRFAKELLNMTREVSCCVEEQNKIFEKAHYDLMENLMEGWVRRKYMQKF